MFNNGSVLFLFVQDFQNNTSLIYVFLAFVSVLQSQLYRHFGCVLIDTINTDTLSMNELLSVSNSESFY